MRTTTWSWRQLCKLGVAGVIMALSLCINVSPVVSAEPSHDRAACPDSFCLYSGTNFSGSIANVGFPDIRCATVPFPARSAINNEVVHIELYQDTACQSLVLFLESGKSNANLPAPVRSYKAFICGQECLKPR